MLNFMYRCKYCGKEYEKASQVVGHTGRCKNNPNRIKNIEKTKIKVGVSLRPKKIVKE